MKRICLLFALAVIGIACNGDTPVYNNTDQTYNIFLSDNNGKVARVTMPDTKVQDADHYKTVNKEELKGPVEWMNEYRDNVFLGIPSARQIIVVSKGNFTKVGVYDFSSSGKIPTSICFANATNAYVTHEDDSVVSLVDLINYKVARFIPCGKNPVSITAIENQLFVACRGDNTIRRIDTRTNIVTAVYSTPPNPVSITNTNDDRLVASERRMVLVCEGNEGDPLSIAKVDINGTITDKQSVIGIGANPAFEIPSDIAVTNTDFAFVTTQTSIWRYDIRKPGAVRRVSTSGAEGISYNDRRNELIIRRNANSVHIAQSSDTKVLSSITTTFPIRAFIELND